MNTSQRGFVALVSVIIISAMLLLVVVSVGLVSFFSRFNMLDTELKERSVAAADACADKALVQLALGFDPSGTVLTINTLDQCRIGTVSGTTQKTFRIQATSSNTAVTNLQIVADGNDYTVISWQEVATF